MVDYDRLAGEYARHRRVHPGVLQQLISTGAVKPASRVLEVGCGTGNYIAALEEAIHSSCWGVEPSVQLLARARARGRRVDFRLGKAEQLPLPPDSFHLVFSVDVIHHLKDPLAYAREAYRVLTVGGWICTVTDSEWIIRNREPLTVYFPETVEVDLRRYPAIADLRASLERAGFGSLLEEIVEYRYALTDIQVYRDKPFSCLHLIPEPAFQRGIERMETALRAGPIRCVSRYLLLWGRKGP